MNLFKTQSELFHRIINPSKLTDPTTNQPLPVWKVLIFDDQTNPLMSNFKVGDLRESNITLHMSSRDKKEPISGVEAIYIISPDNESITNLIRDVEMDIFPSIFLNFVGSLDKRQLQTICDALVKLRKTHVIQEIKQYAVDFTPISSQSFSFCLPNSLGNESADFEDTLAVKLLNMFVTLEYVPLIAYDKSSEQLKRLHRRLSEGIDGKNTRNYLQDFEKIPKNNKAILILHNSADDASSFLYHSFELFPLIVDTFSLFQSKSSFYSAKIEDQKVTIDLKTDKFLQTNMTTEYPQIGLLIHEELEAVKGEHDRLLKRPDSEADQLAFAENFNDALEAVPMVTEKQKNSENHVRIATFVNKHIQNSHLEKVSVLSNQLWRNKQISGEYLADLEEILKSKTVPKREKLRLFCLLSLNWNLDAKVYQNYEVMLSSNGGITDQESALLSKLRDQKYQNPNAGGGFLSKFTNSALQKFKNITSEKFRTKIAISMSSFFKKRDLEDFKVASLGKSLESVNPDSINTVIVVSVSGGNTTELLEVMELGSHLRKDVIYGMTEMATGKQFLDKVIEKNLPMES